MGTSQSSQAAGPKDNNIPHFKIVFIGPPQAGKTSVIKRYLTSQYNEFYSATKELCIKKHTCWMNIPEATLVSLTLWDTPGKEDLDLRDTYYRDVSAAVVVCDLTESNFLELATNWKSEFQHIANDTNPNYKQIKGVWMDYPETIPARPDIPVVLLGNKLDLAVTRRVPVADLLATSEERHGFTAAISISCSANDSSVDDAIRPLLRRLTEESLVEKKGGKLYRETAPTKNENRSALVTDLESHNCAHSGFQNTGTSKLDASLHRLASLHHRVTEWQAAFTRVVRQWRRLCAAAGLIEDSHDTWARVFARLASVANERGVKGGMGQLKLVKEEVASINGETFDPAVTVYNLATQKPYETFLPADIEQVVRELSSSEMTRPIPAKLHNTNTPSTSEVGTTESSSQVTGQETSESVSVEDDSSEVLVHLSPTESLSLIMFHFNVMISPAIAVIQAQVPLILASITKVDLELDSRQHELPAKQHKECKASVAALVHNRNRLVQFELDTTNLLEMSNDLIAKMETVLSPF